MDDPAVVLETFATALRREVHVLAEQPALTWEQLCSRLQWSEPEVRELVDAEAARRQHAGPIWFRTRTPLRESDLLLGSLPVEGASAFAFSPNGCLLCTVGPSVCLWETHTGAELARVDSDGDPTVSCAFTWDGESLLTGTRDGRVLVRDPATLAARLELRVGPAEACCAASPVEALAALASGDVLLLVELPSGRTRASISGRGTRFTCCGFSGDGGLIATGDDAGAIRLWSADPLAEQMSWTVGQGAIKACAFSPDSAFAAVVPSGSSAVTLLGGPDDAGQPQSVTLEHFDQVNDCAVSPDRRWLACASDDKLIWLHDPAHPAEALSALEGHDAPVYHCAFGTNAPLLATAGGDGTVKLWDPSRGRARGGLTGHRGRITAVAFAPDGSFVVTASDDETLRIWDPAPTAERRTLEGHVAAVWDCAVVGDTVVSAAGDGSVRFWAPGSGDVLRVLEIGSLSNAHALAPNGDASLLAVGHDSSVGLWSVDTGEQLADTEIADAGAGGGLFFVQDCTFTSDGERLVVACQDATLRVWDVPSWCELGVLRGHTECVTCCSAVPGGQLCVSGSEDGTLQLWDVDSGEILRVFDGHTDAAWDCAVSADGSLLVSVGWDGHVRLWDLQSGRALAAYRVPEKLRAVALHPSAPRVACGDMGGWLRVLDVMGPLPAAAGTVTLTGGAT